LQVLEQRPVSITDVDRSKRIDGSEQ
jgi:hypothetical protein